MPRDQRLSAENQAFLTNTMTLGKATSLPILLTTNTVIRLIGVIYKDTEKTNLLPESLKALIVPNSDYYTTPTSWFEDPIELPTDTDLISIFHKGIDDISDFKTYLACLASLHKRRLKYSKILSAQPIPRMIQVSPRALVEFGGLQPEPLASWLTWRKWFYDIDNRSAQETGYLFEPILAAALGGESKGARNSPVKRTDEPSKGRQVDCWRVVHTATGARREAYEFKLRVTIAASGQGRFSEELAFARDCKNSDAVPILIVLDPTPNPRLSELADNFRNSGGEAYLGDAAWEHLENEAGSVMAVFIKRYVAEPIQAISKYDSQLLPFSSELLENGDIELTLGTSTHLISRAEDSAFEESDED